MTEFRNLELHKNEAERIPEIEPNVVEALKREAEQSEMFTIARRKLMNSSVAKQRFKRAVLEASYDLSNEFHGPYLSRLFMSDLGRGLLDANHPASTFDTVKKGFLFHLNSTGHYLVLREHLRHAITHVIQQCGLSLRPSGFKHHREFQSFLHDMYIFLAEELHEAFNESGSSETRSSNIPIGRSSFDESVVCFRKLHHFAEEAFAEKDTENCHRLHLMRVCRNHESPEFWTDFAIMWCMRGDDRMAEIALREALKLNPKFVHALLLAGVIAARNKDERAIGFIGQALQIHPLSPEIIVLMAIAHRKLGNEARSKYFFLKARLLHLMLTGKDTARAEAEFTSFQFPDPSAVQQKASQSLTDPKSIEKEMQQLEEWQRKSDSKSSKGDAKSRSSNEKSRTEDVRGPPNTMKNETPRDGGDSTSVKGKKSKQKRKSVGEDVKYARDKSDDETNTKTDKASKKNRKKSPENVKLDPISDMVKDENALFARRTSIAGANALPPRSNSAAKLSYDFPMDVNEENINQMYLPSLVPSIVFTWDVTEPFGNIEGDSNEMAKSSIHFQSNMRNVASGTDVDADINEEYDKFIQSKLISPANSVVKVAEGSGKRSPRKKDTTATTSTKSTYEGKGAGKTPRSGKSNKVPSLKNSSGSADDVSQQSSTQQPPVLPESNKAMNAEEEKLPQASMAKRVWVKKFGSEFIWAAQLFLRYHAYDFMDAVLARELFYTESRSVPFSYILALSLNFRKREKAAKVLIDEWINKPEFKENPYLWEQKGHAHYGLGEVEQASQCFEKAIQLAEPNQNLQIAYLRYGSLNLDHPRLAKSVLLKGANLYPSLYIWIALGKLCYQREQYAEAEAAFSHANRMDNTNPSIWGYLALVNLAQENQTLAEQCYKWAVRFGLKGGAILDEIRSLQQKLGFGDPSLPRVPNCIPHQYYLKRLGRQNLLEVYREALEAPETYFGHKSALRLEETAREAELKRLLHQMQKSHMMAMGSADEDAEDYEEETDIYSTRSLDINLPKRPSQLFKGGKSPKRNPTLIKATKSKARSKSARETKV